MLDGTNSASSQQRQGTSSLQELPACTVQLRLHKGSKRRLHGTESCLVVSIGLAMSTYKGKNHRIASVHVFRPAVAALDSQHSFTARWSCFRLDKTASWEGL